MMDWLPSGDLGGSPSFSKAKQKGVKAFFDNNILHQYVSDFQTQFAVPRDVLWKRVATVLAAGKSSEWRWVKQVGRHGMQVDTEPEPKIKEMLRYIAATGQKVSVPPGREIVLRSLAATLNYVRAQLSDYAGQAITAPQVELLRYALEHPGYIDLERGITEKMIDKMRGDVAYAVEFVSSHSDRNAVEEVRQLIKSWRRAWSLLIESLPYHWIYYAHEI